MEKIQDKNIKIFFLFFLSRKKQVKNEEKQRKNGLKTEETANKKSRKKNKAKTFKIEQKMSKNRGKIQGKNTNKKP